MKNIDSNLWLPIVLTVGALITGIGSWIQYFNERKNKIETLKAEEKADSLARENVTLLKQVNETSLNSFKQLGDVTEKLIAANETIENLRKESLNNALGSDETYLTIDINKPDEIVMHNPSNLPLYDLGLQIWNYNEILKCKITHKDGLYFVEKICYAQSHRSRRFDVIYGKLYFSTNFNRDPEKINRYRALFICRKSKYYVDLIFIEGVGYISRRYKWINNNKTEMEIFNPNKIKVNWDKEFPYPPEMNYI